MQIAAQILFATNGVQSHWVRLDSPHFFGSMLRVWMGAEYHREGSEPWYGVGNATSAAPADHPELSAERPFVYERSYPLLRLGAAYPLLGQGLRAAAFVRYLRMSVRVAPARCSMRQQPLGIEGGTEVEGAAGLYFDRRDHEQLPTKGYLLELSARGAGRGVRLPLHVQRADRACARLRSAGQSRRPPRLWRRAARLEGRVRRAHRRCLVGRSRLEFLFLVRTVLSG